MIEEPTENPATYNNNNIFSFFLYLLRKTKAEKAG
jgi:hypothetical protein